MPAQLRPARAGGDAPRRPGRVAGLLAALLAVLAAVLFGCGAASQEQAAEPPASLTSSAPTAAPTSGAPGSGRAPDSTSPQTTSASTGPVLPASTPTVLDVPRLGVHHDLVELGLNPDGTVEVPPLSQVRTPGWYRYSPTPGELGPAVILGHIDAAEYGKGVFYDLGSMRPGDEVDVTRADGTVAVFAVTDVGQYDKDDFPTDAVYGDLDHAGLRLITCGGAFDAQTRSYEDNIVVFARLRSSHPAG
ncbi:class F sortase [Modestobacter roseus]|uniref:Sortase family protein n=1 Tax=Modestobacter roseus TaxID=1181884 RepID=A0A562IW59_9ACTN|nr:class F sortase [Modestobacter roseus]MQA34705.1 class F sortase [Modestobacter roseus]TWH75132.1 sortase family protein [Modestobacter roseus]